MTLGTGAGALRSADSRARGAQAAASAFRVIRSFEQAGLLEAAGNDGLKLGPRFVARALLSEAVAALAGASPIEWGTALLEGSARSEVETYVIERARATNGRSLEPLLETSDPESFSTSARSSRLRRGGLALLERRRALARVREGLFEDQLELMLELPAAAAAANLARSDAERAERHGLWLLAGSVCPKICRITRASTRFYGPGARRRSSALAQLLDRVAAALESPKLSQAAALGVFALIGRLRTSVGALIGVDTPHALEQPT